MRWILGFFLLAPAFSQDAGRPAQEESIKVDVDVVNVLCTVYDKHGVLVKDLQKEEFRVLEDNRIQEIRYFARDTDLPLTVALLVDVSGSVSSIIEQEKDTAAKFLEAIVRPSDQALLAGFSSTIVLWHDFTSSTVALGEALRKLRGIAFRGLPPEGQPMPATLLYDAVVGVAGKKLKDVSGRKTMVIISDGNDNGSQTHLEDAVREVQATNTIVYGICYDSGFSGCSFLKSIAEPTGGRMFQAGKKTPLSKIFEIIQDEMRSQYAVGYVSSNRARDGGFRKLQVRVQRKNVRVRARRGYFAAGGPEK
jgi:Ca-activated chloride channel family protein